MNHKSYETKLININTDENGVFTVNMGANAYNMIGTINGQTELGYVVNATEIDPNNFTPNILFVALFNTPNTLDTIAEYPDVRLLGEYKFKAVNPVGQTPIVNAQLKTMVVVWK